MGGIYFDQDGDALKIVMVNEAGESVERKMTEMQRATEVEERATATLQYLCGFFPGLADYLMSLPQSEKSGH